jgi:hypothetical protein
MIMKSTESISNIGALPHHTIPNITLWTLHGYLSLYVITI